MTPEQQRHQEEYYRAKRNYENAVIEKRRAENEIANISNRRGQIINQINNLKAEKKRNESSLATITKTIAKNNDIDSGLKDTASKLSDAASWFSAIGESSLAVPPNLVDVFADKDSRSRMAISGAFDQMRTTSSNMRNKIDGLASSIRQLENEMEDGKRRESNLRHIAADQQRVINASSIEMSYHKRHMMM